MIDGELKKLKESVLDKIDLLSYATKMIPEMIYHTLTFDASYVTKEEVQAILDNNHEVIDKEKVQLVLNQKTAFLFVLKMVQENTPMDENNLKDLHQILMHGFSDIGGLYRNVDISVKGSNHTPPSHIKVYDRMKKYFDFTETVKGDLFEFIAYCHVQLVKIYPFLDGNARLSRLVLDYYLLKNGFLPVLFTQDNKQNYYNALEAFKVEKNISPFVEMLKELEKKAIALVA